MIKGVLVLAILAGCGQPPPSDAHPAPAGRYFCGDPLCGGEESAPSFTIDAHGRFDNRDVDDAQVAIRGGTLYVTEYGSTVTGHWLEEDDGVVRTDILDVLYGESDPVAARYRRAP